MPYYIYMKEFFRELFYAVLVSGDVSVGWFPEPVHELLTLYTLMTT